MSVLDTIDNAISDWETSTDAMRWTPEPPQDAPPLIYTPSLDHLVAAARMAEALDRARIGVAAVAEVFAESMKGLGLALAQLLDEPRRPARVVRLRRNYRAKRRHW